MQDANYFEQRRRAAKEFKGVFYERKRDSYQAVISLYGTRTPLGRFETAEAAGLAWAKMREANPVGQKGLAAAEVAALVKETEEQQGWREDWWDKGKKLDWFIQNTAADLVTEEQRHVLPLVEFIQAIRDRALRLNLEMQPSDETLETFVRIGETFDDSLYGIDIDDLIILFGPKDIVIPDRRADRQANYQAGGSVVAAESDQVRA